MSKTIVNYDAQGNVVSRTVVSRSGCGCGGFLTVILVIFVISAPAVYAGQGMWPLGWAGAVLAYIVEAALLAGGIVVAMQRSRSGQ